MNIIVNIILMMNTGPKVIEYEYDFETHGENNFANHQGPTWPPMGKQQRQVFSSMNFVRKVHLQKKKKIFVTFPK